MAPTIWDLRYVRHHFSESMLLFHFNETIFFTRSEVCCIIHLVVIRQCYEGTGTTCGHVCLGNHCQSFVIMEQGWQIVACGLGLAAACPSPELRMVSSFLLLGSKSKKE